MNLPTPPRIAPVPKGEGRPFWSVMIPTYNAADLLEKTLRSVLDQDSGPDRMEIVVVDDCSPNCKSEQVVRHLAPGRVGFYRQPSNLGLAGNWSWCISRSRGNWLHILHQDDFVLPGFYERMARASEHPDVGAAFCRHFFIDGKGRQESLMGLEQPTAGVLINWLRTISQHQHIQFPSIVVRRSVYEHLGGFRADLCYALDWEMYVRIAASCQVWYEPEPLACYRIHEGNETSRLKRMGRDIADVHKAIRIMHNHLPPELRAMAGQLLLAHFRDNEMRATTRAFSERELGSGMASLRRAIQCDPSLRFSYFVFAHYKWALKIAFGELLSHLPKRKNDPSLK